VCRPSRPVTWTDGLWVVASSRLVCGRRCVVLTRLGQFRPATAPPDRVASLDPPRPRGLIALGTRRRKVSCCWKTITHHLSVRGHGGSFFSVAGTHRAPGQKLEARRPVTPGARGRVSRRIAPKNLTALLNRWNDVCSADLHVSAGG